MAFSCASLLGPELLIVAVILIGLAVSWDNFLLLRVKPYSMPAGSMEPSLQVGDMFLAVPTTSSISLWTA